MFLGSKARPVGEANNFVTICEPIVYTVRDPQHLTTCYIIPENPYSEQIFLNTIVPRTNCLRPPLRRAG
jgi:hypothetical protein